MQISVLHGCQPVPSLRFLPSAKHRATRWAFLLLLPDFKADLKPSQAGGRLQLQCEQPSPLRGSPRPLIALLPLPTVRLVTIAAVCISLPVGRDWAPALDDRYAFSLRGRESLVSAGVGWRGRGHAGLAMPCS